FDSKRGMFCIHVTENNFSVFKAKLISSHQLQDVESSKVPVDHRWTKAKRKEQLSRSNVSLGKHDDDLCKSLGEAEGNQNCSTSNISEKLLWSETTGHSLIVANVLEIEVVRVIWDVLRDVV
ncbi:hypothetical protein IGI04_022664, partial [Brassica rapa subsp. trilocularis]